MTMVVLGAIALADMLCEGAAAEWSAVYLRDNKHTTLAFAGLGFTVYSLAMVSVRLSGNRLLRWRRPERLLPVLAGVATFGLVIGLGDERDSGPSCGIRLPRTRARAGGSDGLQCGRSCVRRQPRNGHSRCVGLRLDRVRLWPPTHRSDRVSLVFPGRSGPAPGSDSVDRTRNGSLHCDAEPVQVGEHESGSLGEGADPPVVTQGCASCCRTRALGRTLRSRSMIPKETS